jgi:uncharacterized Zn finger protein
MEALSEAFSVANLGALATPSNLRLGQEIVSQGGVEIIGRGQTVIRAKVGGVPSAGQRRTVSLEFLGGTRHWSCSCSKDAGLFCKHVVATALIAQFQSAA